MEDEKVKENICHYIKEGMLKKDAAVMSGISEPTLYRWIGEDESFKSRLEASVLEYKHTLVKNVNEGATKDGKLALEILRRRFPKEWGGKSDFEEKETYEGSTREVADLLQKLLHNYGTVQKTD